MSRPRVRQNKKVLPEDRKSLVEDNLKLVHNVIHKQLKIPKGADYEDYFQVGCLGLVKAAMYFKPELGYSFSTYAVPMILGEMKRYRMDYGSDHTMIRLPRSVNSKIAKLLDEGKTEEAEELGYLRNVYELDAPVNIKSRSGDSVYNSWEMLEDLRSSIHSLSDVEVWSVLEVCLTKTLEYIYSHSNSDIHKDLFEEYIYSLIYGEEKLGQQYLADKYGLSQAQVSRNLRNYTKLFKKIYDMEAYGKK